MRGKGQREGEKDSEEKRRTVRRREGDKDGEEERRVERTRET